MSDFKIIGWIVFFGLNIGISHAQDTTEAEQSNRIYQKIEAFSDRNMVSKYFFNLVFKSTLSDSVINTVIITPNQKLKIKYEVFEGKPIRHIYIRTFDPFGNAIYDSASVQSPNLGERFGNALHVKTNTFTIRNLLLIKPKQAFDSLLVKESERLVRSMNYIHDVVFECALSGLSGDSVDIYIRTLDKWSIIPMGNLNGNNIEFDLSQNNVLGFGHQSKAESVYNVMNQNYKFNTSYQVTNILNSHIIAEARYQTDVFDNMHKSISLDRSFFSIYTRWAAGIYIGQDASMGAIHYPDTVTIYQIFRYNTHDYWNGYAWNIFKNKTPKDRPVSLVAALRLVQKQYIEKLKPEIDSLNLYSSEDFVMGHVGISSRRYMRDKYMFRFGVPEDIPVGHAFKVTLGYQSKFERYRYYFNSSLLFGEYLDLGYFGTFIEYETYFRDFRTEQGLLNLGVNYYTLALKIGKWRFRQFFKAQMTVGIERWNYESLTLNDGYGLDGFNSLGLVGKSRILFKWQTQSYAPWNVLGFRFGPYFVYSMGSLIGVDGRFDSNPIYTHFGVGVLIKNENMVFNNFQISFSYYPTIPGVGNSIYKMDSFKAADFELRDYSVGKPSVIGYQ